MKKPTKHATPKDSNIFTVIPLRQRNRAVMSIAAVLFTFSLFFLTVLAGSVLTGDSDLMAWTLLITFFISGLASAATLMTGRPEWVAIGLFELP